jgi:glycosyltransferase involved in cell wall biosynthesis
MKTVVINALNSNSGGGKSIVASLVQLLNAAPLSARYVVFVAHDADLSAVGNPNLKVVPLPARLSKKHMAPWAYRVALKRYIDEYSASVVLNFGDVIIDTRKPQIYVFDWSYALDVHPKVWADISARDRLIVAVKLVLHWLYLKEPEVVIAQTEGIRTKLIEKYRLSDVRVIGNAPTLSSERAHNQLKFSLPEGTRLLCPSLYYPHKNLEVLLDVAQAIKDRGDDYRIIITVTANSPRGERFLASISKRGLQGVLFNVGQVPLANMQDLYAQCQGVIFPSLLESFSIVYSEAMAHGLPIMTSDLLFAHAVCGDAAAYFQPTDPTDILRAIDIAMKTPESRDHFSNAGRQRLSALPTWEGVFASYKAVIEDILAR